MIIHTKKVFVLIPQNTNDKSFNKKLDIILCNFGSAFSTMKLDAKQQTNIFAKM